jgi:hypothetical protein
VETTLDLRAVQRALNNLVDDGQVRALEVEHNRTHLLLPSSMRSNACNAASCCQLLHLWE